MLELQLRFFVDYFNKEQKIVNNEAGLGTDAVCDAVSCTDARCQRQRQLG